MRSLENIQRDWQDFILHQKISKDLDPLIVNSWRRSRPRLNPWYKVNIKKLYPENLEAARKASEKLISLARPIMEDIYQYVEGSNTVTLLVNSAAYVLDMCGDPSMLYCAREHAITEGAFISEGQVGTISFAIPLFEGVPARVIGAEHFLAQFHDLADVAAPIFSPAGRILGILGLITKAENYHPHSFGIVISGARAIEGQLIANNLLDEQNNQLTELNTILATLSEGILVWDSEGNLIHVNETATKILRLSHSRLLGRPINEQIGFPPVLKEALQNHQTLENIELNLKVGDNTINCVLSLTYAQMGENRQWIIATLREGKDIRRLVQSQMSGWMALSISDVIGESAQMSSVRRLAKASANARAGILIRGESGSGKQDLARIIHNESQRREGPFLIFNCKSIPSGMILSELLGHDEGVSLKHPGGRPSKFELAQGGTLYLQEIESLPMEAQAVLLNTIDLGIVMRLGSARAVPVDVRIIASTTANLEKLIAGGNFRADLYYRLSPFEINLPPLRERKDDIPNLVEKILRRFNKQQNRSAQFTQEVLELLKGYSWPGNIRELEFVVERAILQAGNSEIIVPMHLPDYVRIPGTGSLSFEFNNGSVKLKDIEREAVIRAARIYSGNVTKMAAALGVGRTTVWRIMKRMNLAPEQFKE
ncbi:MAG TPA: sigma 54-interacting transcriptional regulator [Anaerolineae bacterium]|nr:sigma 54-interacting transcriptional regulator [Anaerolineae bacterium]